MMIQRFDLRSILAALALITGILSAAGATAFAQEPPAQTPPAQTPPAQTPPAAAPAPSELKIAVIDIGYVIQKSKAASGLQKDIEKLRQSYQTEISQEEAKLRKAEQDLLAQKPNLSAEDFSKKRQDIDVQAAKLRSEVDNKRAKLDKIFGDGQNQVRKALNDIVTEMAQKNGYSLVINKSAVIILATDFDITQEVLKQLDKKLPAVKTN